MTLEGKKTYVTAVMLGLASFAMAMGWLNKDQYEIVLGLVGSLGLAALRSGVATPLKDKAKEPEPAQLVAGPVSVQVVPAPGVAQVFPAPAPAMMVPAPAPVQAIAGPGPVQSGTGSATAQTIAFPGVAQTIFVPGVAQAVAEPAPVQADGSWPWASIGVS